MGTHFGRCLCFYWGCPNLESYIDSRAFIRLNLDDFESSYRIIVDAIENDEWSKRIDIIRAEQEKNMYKYNTVARVADILSHVNQVLHNSYQ